MKRLTIYASMALSLGLTIALLWLLSGPSTRPPAARAADLHVCPSGCAYSSVQAAVDAAGDGDVIKVATGTYTGINNYGGLAQVVYINKSVTIRGGYTAAFTEPPDPEANPTTLDAQGQGRVMYITGNINPTIEGLRITGGYSDGGSGVYVNQAMATLRDNVAFSNTSTNSGGGLSLHYSAATLIGNTIISNTTTAGSGGGLFLSDSDNATLAGNTIASNSAANSGGGLYLSYFDIAMLSGNVVISNTTTGSGGGLYLGRPHGGCYGTTLINNVVADNQADTTGSGLYIAGSPHRLLHTTIARNIGGDGSGVYFSGDLGDPSTVVLTNTILVSHTVGVYVESGSSARLEGTLWGSGTWANDSDWSGDGDVITGTINVRGDPAFVNPDAGDYHIGPGSAALDQGVDTEVLTDMDNEPRFYGDPDLGADEYWPPGALKRVYLPLVLR